MKRLFLHIVFLAIATMAMADAVGTWKLYPSYSNITEVQYTKADSSEVFVLASGNLFAYYNSDKTFSEFMIEGASSATGTSYGILSSRDISHIAWCAAVKKLIIVYSDGMIDLLNAKDRNNPTVTSIVGLKETTLFNDKTVDSIYVGGQFAYFRTASHIVKIDVKDEYIVKTYKTTEKLEVEGMTEAPLMEPVALNYKYGSTTVPVGPKYIENNFMRIDNGRLLSVRGAFGYDGDTSTPGDVQEYNIATGAWECYGNSFAVTKNKNCITHCQFDVDPRDKNHIMVASKSGLYSYRNGVLDAYYDYSTDDPIVSVLDNSASAQEKANYSIISSVKYDSSGNLWIFNLGNHNLLCLTASGEWKTYYQDVFASDDSRSFTSCIIDSRGLLWFVNGTWKVPMCGFYDFQANMVHVLTRFENQDGAVLECPYQLTVEEDKNNNVWIGYYKGCFYITPETIAQMRQTEGDSHVSIVQPKVNRTDGSGLADYLLSGSLIHDIKIDDANRKWIATSNGVYEINSDCSTQEHHFTTDDSPLPTNYVKNIALDKASGVVYMATDKGVCSYQSDITTSYGDLSSNNVYAYPNPVTPEYTGDISIIGLTNGCRIKIVNTAGQIVHSGVCNGGSYSWNGCDATGGRVASGVYMVLVSNVEGDDGCVAKIAVIK